ncbi:Cof-type HAD-IIB family hydrolase [Bacillus sp. FJAT-47783]|uniref:Cof-type HAD-IIB family hydrolase n=1 Tax=Bacillus sp. FJAT-47783 TaxID=2922712 RepID=UPI001FAC13C6|nr:Cof-type HAD-IIB family hydrolase [Bacillus sp. FJAT-47783]
MKIIAIDMDGTLLNSAEEITDENANAIKKAQSQGVEVVIATGRTYQTATSFLKKVNVNVPIICLNGADVRNPLGEKLVSVPIASESFIKIDEVCKQHDIHFEVCTNIGIYSVSKERSLQVRIDIVKSANLDINERKVKEHFNEHVALGYIKFINSFRELLKLPDLEVYKVLVFSVEEEKLAHVKAELIDDKDLCITSSGRENLEINHINAQKGMALEKFAAERGVEMKDVMAIGDNFNDLSMLKRAGRSVAMGNAEEEIKKVCHFVTKTNNEHGVAHAIEEMLKEYAKM